MLGFGCILTADCQLVPSIWSAAKPSFS